MIDYMSLMEHVCCTQAILVEHNKPRLQCCTKCECSLNDEICDKLGLPHIDAVCPECGNQMIKEENKDSAQLFVEVCIDKYCHYPELYKDGKITSQEYNDWVATLTPREKMGFYERKQKMQVVIDLNSAELKMKDSDTVQFEALINTKLRDRINLTLQYEHQTSYKPKRSNVPNIIPKGINKN